MKKVISIFALLILLVSCGGPSKVAKEARKTFDGNWTLTNITYPNNTGEFNVTLFNDASANCFEGSTWDFVSNNNRGTYEVSGLDCVAETRNFIWSIDEENTPSGMYDFLLKPVNEKYKSTNGDQGFRLNLVNLSENSMVWEQTVTLEGSPFVIRMMFTK
ncbi:lipocalin family protein [Zunongwangia endophytica]|uniref:Lipocalin family protein n=1 Tax=Zunongwangia endophytica TaxID=1808945 RepID=A0ABV8HCD9_9FLAO|nr:lipocalin family protein [Zunongwangia endophytica]MDN3594048.1 lipocalin family protein [Zunongwangia endophytica]